VAFGCVGMVAGYALVRLAGAWLGERESPSSVLWLEHSPMRWSLLLALWLGGMVALAGWLLVGRSPEAAPGWLGRGIVFAAAACLLQGLFWP
jgi:hypothetical protein